MDMRPVPAGAGEEGRTRLRLSGVIDALIAAGGSAEQVLAVVRAAEAEQDAAEAARRAKEAARKKAYRQMVDAQKSRVVPQCPGDAMGQSGTNGTSPPIPPEKETPRPQEKLTPLTPKTPDLLKQVAPKGGVDNRGAVLPADWAPKRGHFDRSAAKGHDECWVLDQAEAMREWAESNSNRSVARKANWDRTFDGWLRRAFARPSNANGARAGPKPRPMSMFDATIDLLAELHDKHH